MRGARPRRPEERTLTPVRRLADFYLLQLRLLWTWRRGRRDLVVRGVVSFLFAFVSLGITIVVLPGIHVRNVLTVGEAVVVFAILNALVRPVLLAILLPLSIVAVGIASLVFQAGVLLVLAPLVPGLQVDNVESGIAGAWLFAIVGTTLAAVFATDQGESYYGTLVRQLVARRRHVTRSAWPGLVVVQVDGLAHPVLQHQVRAGRLPVISRWLRAGTHRLARWDVLLPSQTSASQGGILFGTNDGIPAFRWYEKSTGRLIVSNRPDDAHEIERRLTAAGQPLLADGGASIGNLLSGGATWSLLTMSTLRDRHRGLGPGSSLYFFFLSPYGYLHALLLSVGEIVRELYQARNQRLAGVEPRGNRGFPYPVARAVTTVALHDLSTSLVIEQMYRGTPVIYVDFTDYDEVAHHSGPERAEALDAADGVDAALGTLERAARDAPRPYRFIVLSDHGQSLGATFRQRFGDGLEEVIRALMGGPAAIHAATTRVEEWGPINTFLTEMTRAGGLTGRASRVAFRRRTRDGLVTLGSGRPSREPGRQPEPREAPEVVVAASGNLANVYFTAIPTRATLEELADRYPGLVDALANHPGIGFVLVRSAGHGPLVVGRDGVRHLADGSVSGTDPLVAFGPLAEESVRRLDSMDACGDLAVISMYDPDTDEVAAFEELIGSHGGLGGMQTAAFVIHPADLTVPAPLVGAPALGAQLRQWIVDAELLGNASPADVAVEPVPA